MVIDKGYFSDKDEHRKAVESILDLITDTVRREMHIGGVVVTVLQDVSVNLRQGERANTDRWFN